MYISYARRCMAGKREAVERSPRLVDLGTRAVYRLAYRKQLIGTLSYNDSLIC